MNFDEILHDCLVSLESGGTIKECVARYPEQAAALQPLLEATVAVHSAPLQGLSEDAFARGQAKLWAAAEQNRRAQPSHRRPQQASTHLTRTRAQRRRRPQWVRGSTGSAESPWCLRQHLHDYDDPGHPLGDLDDLFCRGARETACRAIGSMAPTASLSRPRAS